MRIVALFFSCFVIAVCSCRSHVTKSLPVEKLVYMPQDFEDDRVKANPWRNTEDKNNTIDPSVYIPKGPAYPYEFTYNPSTCNYEVVLRRGAPYIDVSSIIYSRSAEPYTIEIPRRE
ncbi:MAG: hypothetical protein ABIH42_06635 [Planctomycetota bacterium]